jgi:hypothetical protein
MRMLSEFERHTAFLSGNPYVACHLDDLFEEHDREILNQVLQDLKKEKKERAIRKAQLLSRLMVLMVVSVIIISTVVFWC